LPLELHEILGWRERVTVLPNDAAAVARFVRAQARRAQPNRGAA
jgi:hypothetical protein